MLHKINFKPLVKNNTSITVHLSLTKLKRTILRCFNSEKQWKSANGKKTDGKILRDKQDK